MRIIKATVFNFFYNNIKLLRFNRLIYSYLVDQIFMLYFNLREQFRYNNPIIFD